MITCAHHSPRRGRGGIVQATCVAAGQLDVRVQLAPGLPLTTGGSHQDLFEQGLCVLRSNNSNPYQAAWTAAKRGVMDGVGTKIKMLQLLHKHTFYTGQSGQTDQWELLEILVES